MRGTSKLPAGTPTQIVVLASGTGTLLQALLAAAGPNYQVSAVVTDRPCAALDHARAAGIATHCVPLDGDRDAWNKQLGNTVAHYRPDVVVSAGFMKILGPDFVHRFTVINTHPALLPAFPGAHAVRDALAYGVTITGCTVHYVDEGVDTGPIIAQRAVEIEPGDTEESLHNRIKTVERQLIVQILQSGQWRKPHPTARP